MKCKSEKCSRANIWYIDGQYAAHAKTFRKKAVDHGHFERDAGFFF